MRHPKHAPKPAALDTAYLRQIPSSSARQAMKSENLTCTSKTHFGSLFPALDTLRAPRIRQDPIARALDRLWLCPRIDRAQQHAVILSPRWVNALAQLLVF